MEFLASRTLASLFFTSGISQIKCLQYASDPDLQGLLNKAYSDV